MVSIKHVSPIVIVMGRYYLHAKTVLVFATVVQQVGIGSGVVAVVCYAPNSG